ncbi:error-prone DNA polymerase, partial [Bacteriovoracaceae bacterium]|nr:error-prone DNA polymerase [Bacteriovoracaceae bacterium]
GKGVAYLSLSEILSCDLEGLIGIKPMRGWIRSGTKESDWGALYEKLKGNLIFALGRHCHQAEDYWIKPTYHLAKKLNAPTFFSQDIFFHHPKQKVMSDLLNVIRTNKTFETSGEHLFPNDERCFHSKKELSRLWSYYRNEPFYESSWSNICEIQHQIDFNLDMLRYEYPKEMIPEGDTAQGFLEKLVWKGATKRFGSPLTEKIRLTLHHELELIEKLSFADYFLTVWDIVAWARGQKILCQGRGSAANSSVCYVLEITAVDPSHFDLLFERFMSMERGDPPDIDVDFEHERREEVIQYIYKRYGRGKAAMVANVITFRTRGAMRSVAKAFGASDGLQTEIARIAGERFSTNLPQDMGSKIFNRSKSDSKEEIPILEVEEFPWQLWGRLVEMLKGFPRHLGIHSGGFIVSNNSLNTLVAQEPASMDGRSVIQWAKEDVEGLGLFKIDILALGMLSAMRKCFSMVRDHYGMDLSLYSIPADDGPTYSMIQRADTVGTFQIESRAQMSMLPRLRPRCFYDLVIEVAIIRPGPIQGKVIHPYLRRREGTETVTFPDEKLRPILAKTLGVAIFQEQAMRIAMAVGDFTPGEADELRKNIGIWNFKEFERNLNPWLEKLRRGMEQNNIGEPFIDQILGQMNGFAHYGFPESHAVSFALIAYASSYLKCHFPAAFFTSILNSMPMGFYSPHVLLQTAKRAHVKVLGVCVQKSFWDCRLERIGSSKDHQVYGIRMGFRLVTGLKKKSAEKLVTARETLSHGKWTDLHQLILLGGCYRDDMTALASADALNILGIDRKKALWQVEKLPSSSLIDDDDDDCMFRTDSSMEKIAKDFLAFKTTLGDHPVVIMKKEHWKYDLSKNSITRSSQIHLVAKDSYLWVYGMVIIEQSPPSAKGMVFITLEDESGFINLAFSNGTYIAFRDLIEKDSFLCVGGILQKMGEAHSVMVQRVLG